MSKKPKSGQLQPIVSVGQRGPRTQLDALFAGWGKKDPIPYIRDHAPEHQLPEYQVENFRFTWRFVAASVKGGTECEAK